MPKDEDGCPYQPVPRIVDSLKEEIINVACGKAHSVAVSARGSWRKIQTNFSGERRDARRNFCIRPVFDEILRENGVEMQEK